MGRFGGALVLVVLLGAGCATRSGPAVGTSAAPAPAPAPPPPPAAPPPAVAAPETKPFTDRELADEMRRQGIGASPTGRTATGPAAEVLPEIKETSRGVVITLPHAHFAFDSADLGPEARRVVERMAYVLNNPRAMGRRVVLEGHADSVGTAAYNLTLSRQRAETVGRELVGQGVQRDRITVEAYGEARPIAPNRNPDGTDNPAGRARNRRVEAVIR